MITREQLTWALNSAIPHAHALPALSVVGLESVTTDDGRALSVYATDRHTFGVAYLNDWSSFDEDVYAPLTRREATELLRFVRPGKVAEQVQSVNLMVRDKELHVGLFDGDGVVDSAVFEIRQEAYFVHQDLSDLFGRLWNAHPSTITNFNPDLLGRFAKVSRSAADRMEFRPVYLGKAGGMAVAMQEHFIGGIAGMTSTVPSGNDEIGGFAGAKSPTADVPLESVA